MRKSSASLMITALLITVLLIASCGGSTTSQPTTTTPPTTKVTTTPVGTTTQPTTTQPTPTTTPLVTTTETTIPSDYTTYTSEGLFSISYPPDWEHSLPITELFDRFTKEELITIIESDLPIVDGSPVLEFPTVFFADVPTEGGDNPYVAIVVGSPSAGTLDGVVEAMSSSYKDNPATNYIEFSREKTTVGGREAVIIDFQSVNLYTGTTVRWLSMYTLVGKTLWLIGCLTPSEMFSDYEEDFYAIVNSFRMLN